MTFVCVFCLFYFLLPQKEARALCLELLIQSKDNPEVMDGFVQRRGLTFIKGWLAGEASSVPMIKLLLTVAKVRGRRQRRFCAFSKTVLGVLYFFLLSIVCHRGEPRYP